MSSTIKGSPATTSIATEKDFPPVFLLLPMGECPLSDDGIDFPKLTISP